MSELDSITRSEIDIDLIEKSFFKKGNPLKKLLKVAIDLLQADQVGILYGTNESKKRFLPNSLWDRGIADMFDGLGSKGLILKYFGRHIVSAKNLSPVYFYKTDASGKVCDNDGMISYMLRTCAGYYRQGISVVFTPDISADVYQIDERYAAMPLYNYNGILINKPNFTLNVDLNIIRHFDAKNHVSIYIPDYGILVANTANQELLARKDGRFVHDKKLKQTFDILIHLVEVASLAALGRLKGRRGARLLREKERQLRSTAGQLIENERIYRDLYENAPIAYFSLDSQGTIIKVNQTTLALSGYEKQELTGHPAMEFYVHDHGKKMTPDQLLSLLDAQRSIKDLEIKFRNKNNREIWLNLCADTVRDMEDRVIEIRVMAVDISERKALEKQLLQARKMEAIGTLAGGIAHDFNNLLTPISGYSEMLLMNTKPGEIQQQAQYKIIHDCARYAKGLVNQMLTFSNQKETELSLARPQAVVQEALALAKAFLPAGIDMQEKILPHCGPVMVDPIQIQQVVINLVSNAVQAMETTGGCLTVEMNQMQTLPDNRLDANSSSPETADVEPGPFICLEIRDTGPGIPKAHLEHIFKPFFTTKAHGKGSGIGLSVVHGIIRSHGGRITVSSIQGKGTCFYIYLPVYCGECCADAPSFEKESMIQTGSERILLVEDDTKVAGMMQYILENLGYTVIVCLKSPQALELFKAEPEGFDLVITDFTMPDLTGDQLSEKLCRIRPDIPIILYTGFGECLDKQKIRHLGVQGFFNKPFTVKEVSGLIRGILDRQKD